MGSKFDDPAVGRIWEGHGEHDDPPVEELKKGRTRVGINMDRATKEPIEKAEEDVTRHPLEVEIFAEQARASGQDKPYMPPGPIRAPEQNPPLNLPFGDTATAPLNDEEIEHVRQRAEHILDPDRAIAAGLTAQG